MLSSLYDIWDIRISHSHLYVCTKQFITNPKAIIIVKNLEVDFIFVYALRTEELKELRLEPLGPLHTMCGFSRFRVLTSFYNQGKYLPW